MALISVMNLDVSRDESDKELAFKTAVVAANFENATKILEAFDEVEREKASGGYTKPEDIKPLTVDDKQLMLSEFGSFGLGG